jgi:hypothetical protein
MSESQKKFSWWIKTITGVAVGAFSIIGGLIALKQYLDESHLSADSTLTAIKRENKLVVGYIPYYDMTSKNPTDERVSGYLVDVLYKLADDMKIPEGNSFSNINTPRSSRHIRGRKLVCS